MELNVICGQLDAFCIFYFVDIHRSMEMMIKKSCKWFKKASLNLMEKNGMM